MGLKHSDIIIGDDGGRDAGKFFVLTEKPALVVERWVMRAMNGLARANVDIPDTVVGAGIVGVWVMGVKMLFAMDFQIGSELADEMLDCVRYRPDPKNPEYDRPIIGPKAFEGDVMELSTLRRLREEVFRIHAGFTIDEAVQKLKSLINPPTSSNTETSRASSEP